MAELVVASFNVHAGVDGWGRPFDLVDACRQLGADVLVLEEAFSPGLPGGGEALGAEVAEALGYEVRSLPMAPCRIYPPPADAGPRWGPPRRRRRGLGLRADRPGAAARPARRAATEAVLGTVGIALLSRLPIRTSEVVDFGRLRRDASRRGALVAELDLDGRPLVVVGTHMSHLRHGSPLQFAHLRRGLPPRDVAAVILGDMNLWGPPLALLLPGWRRAVRARTWPAWRPVAQSDHVLVSPSLSVREGSAVRLGRSDHLAVRAVVALP